jgi:hypothetical protein
VLFAESLKEAATGVRERINDAVAEVKAEQDQDAREQSARDDHA